jgi:glycosyltransferase involved in cell wall biosynthesis
MEPAAMPDDLQHLVHDPAWWADGGGLEERRRIIHSLRQIWANASVERTLTRLIDVARPDIVYERLTTFAAGGALTCRRLGVPHILEVNAQATAQGKRYNGLALSEASELLEHAAYSATDHIRCISEELKGDLAAAGVPEGKMTVIACGVDVDVFTPHGPSFRERVAGEIVLGFVSSLKPWHGIDILARCFRTLATDARYHLLIVGDGPERGEIDALSRELPGRVTHVGAIEQCDVAAHIRGMDIALAPYPDLKPFPFSPLKILEYMAIGRPVIASRIGQNVDLLGNGRFGELVPPGDVEALAGAIQALAGDAARRTRLGTAAAREAREAHTWTSRAADVATLAAMLVAAQAQ